MSIVSQIVSMPKMSLVPVEGDFPWIPIVTMFNPSSLAFSRKSKFKDAKDGETPVGQSVPDDIHYESGEPIELSLEFYFDYYESKKDVRPEVRKILHLTEPQKKCKDKDGKDLENEERPPRVLFIWKDCDPLGTGEPYCSVITDVKVDYLMFLDDGTPCRAKIGVSCKQAALLKGLEDLKKTTQFVLNLAGYTAAAIEAIKGARAALEATGAKIEDPSTWPESITIQI